MFHLCLMVFPEYHISLITPHISATFGGTSTWYIHNIYLQLLNFFHLYIKHAVMGNRERLDKGGWVCLSQCVCRGLYSGPSAIRHLFQRRSEEGGRVNLEQSSTTFMLSLLKVCCKDCKRLLQRLVESGISGGLVGSLMVTKKKLVCVTYQGYINDKITKNL